MIHRRMPAVSETVLCLVTCLVIAAAVIAIDVATLTDGETLTREGGGIEMLSMLGYLAAIVLYFWKRPRPIWPIPVTLLFMAAREFDADKRFTSEGILSTKILFYDTPLWEKTTALTVWVALAVTLIVLIRRRGPVLLAALKRGMPWALAFAAGFLLAGFSKSIDGLARKLAPWGVVVPSDVDRYAGTLEECLELLIPVVFMVAILLRDLPRSAELPPAGLRAGRL
ncbi:hypothetical protein [uncultured Jannaschia sp.]|uniref:hypothetical protein n=1 Tax=uncultured Jannaschia sp. TaxID=293347 RepID=UPI0026062467|nr:hypothetical protein [uncultured Jannaschia sp.]